MLKLYCTECGSPNPYSLNKPKYCGNCGLKFDKTEEKETNKIKSIDADQEDFSDIDYVPQIKNLDFEISNIKPQEITIKDIVGTSDQINTKNIYSNPNQAEPNKNFLDRFKEEAGAIRPKNRNFKNNAKQKG